MSTVLFRPLPLPQDAVRPGVGLLVLALHVALLWLANLYWPLHTVLLGAMQNTVQSVTVQIFQKTPERSKPDESDTVNAKQAITNPGRQRLGRSEAMLALPPAQTTSSTPLAGTAQSVQTAPPRPVLAAQPVPAALAAASAAPAAQARPLPTNDAASAPNGKPVPPVVVRSFDEVWPEPSRTTPPATPLPAATPAAPVASVVPAAPAAAEAAPVSIPNTANTAVTSNASSSASTGTASGAAQTSSAGSVAAGSPQGTVQGAIAAPATPSTNAVAPLNLNLPPRYIYRPPIALPLRSLSEMANEQLRRKPRDAFAESMESAGSIDCLKDAPDGAAQGLLAIGPLLKRAIEEKCRK